MPANLILTNGKIQTVNPASDFVQAVAIGDGRFTAMGTSQSVLPQAGSDCRIIDLGGRTVIPGIVDSHNHIINAGALLEGVMLFDARDMDDVRAAVARRVAQVQPGEWIEGGGWIESQFRERRAPTRFELDEVSPGNPVYLGRLFAGAVVNSRALDLARIDRDTPDPQRGTIVRDPLTSEATGLLINGAQSLVRKLLRHRPGEAPLERTLRHIETACREYVRWGITSALDPGVGPLEMQAYQTARESGRLPLRLNMMPAWYGLSASADEPNLDAVAAALGARTGLGDEWLRLGALKMAIDGGLATRTAFMNRPFRDGTTSQVPLRLDTGRLEEYFTLGISRDWSIGIHCCGDRAQDVACDAFARVLDRTGRKPHRHHIIHGYLPTERALDTMAEHGLAVSVQPGFMWVEGDSYPAAVEDERLHYFTPLRTYLRHGIKVAANSDMTSAHYNPFLGMFAAVARRSSQGLSLGTAERIDRLAMIRLFTLNGAWLCGEDHLKGSIEVGKLADLAVLSSDLFSIPEDEIRDVQVDLTVIGGSIAHRRLGAGV